MERPSSSFLSRMFNALVFVSLCAVATATISSSSSATTGIHFLAVGDWGGSGSTPFTTPAQIASASGMDLIAKNINSQFVVALGDNFYDSGISTNENSARFGETFETVYTGSYLQSPWYVVAGNHGKNFSILF
jgi:hypothetical protein